MRNSVRYKLLMTLCGLIVFFVVLFLIFNRVFLTKYYLYSKRNMLMESYDRIVALYEKTSVDFVLELEKLENMKGLRIVIVDKDQNLLYDSRRRDVSLRFGMRNIAVPDQTLRLIREKAAQLLRGKTIVENWFDQRTSSNFITLYSALSDRNMISISTPVSAIEENARIANRFFMFTGIITLLIGVGLIYFIADSFTKPILELNDIAQRMSRLDFSKRYTVKEKDEIGQLGESINSLAEQLQKSISELQAANEKLKQDIEKERKIDERRKEFIANVSHELKTPIALILGYAEGLKVNVNEDEESKNYYCDVIIDEALKMNRLVHDLLNLSQLESDKIALNKTNFMISELVESVIKKNQIILKGEDIEIKVHRDKDIIVNADFEKIEQVLVNYLNNAVNHVDERKLIRVGIEQIGNKARVSVFNSGAHIPDDSIDRIWSSFYKVDKARTRAYGGTGIGLSIVKAIQDAHGNGYGVKNVADGVEFWFEVQAV